MMRNVTLPLTALALAVLTTLTAHAERVDVTLEGKIDTLVSDVYTFSFYETPPPEGMPIAWAKVGERYPEQWDGFAKGGNVKIHFGFDPASGMLDQGDLTDSKGHVTATHQSLAGMRLTAAGDFWAAGFPIYSSLGLDEFYVNVRLTFDPDTFALDGTSLSAAQHLNALAHVREGKASMSLGSCPLGPGHPGEVLCTSAFVTLERATFATADRSVTVAVPEPSLPALALVGLVGVGLARRRQGRGRGAVGRQALP